MFQVEIINNPAKLNVKTILTKDVFCQTNESDYKSELHSPKFSKKSNKCCCRKQYARRNTDSFLDMRSKLNEEFNRVILKITKTYRLCVFTFLTV